MLHRIIFLSSIIIVLTFISGFPRVLGDINVSDALLTLREKSEIGISYFISCDYDNAITSLNEAINFANELIKSISNENESQAYGTLPGEIKLTPSKSELITSIRRYTTEAVKAYIIGRTDRVLERVIAIQNILKVVLNKAIEIQNSPKSSLSTVTDITNIQISSTNLEREVLTEIKGLGKKLYSPLVITQVMVIGITNLIERTNVVTREENILSTKYLWYIVGSTLIILLALLFLFLRYRLIKKRMNDISDLL